jgi:hypothetical protein
MLSLSVDSPSLLVLSEKPSPLMPSPDRLPHNTSGLPDKCYLPLPPYDFGPEPDPALILAKLHAHRTMTERHRAHLKDLLTGARGFASNMQSVQQELQETRTCCDGVLRKIEAVISARAC